MFESWWPFKPKVEAAAKTAAHEQDKRLNQTRRILRHVMREVEQTDAPADLRSEPAQTPERLPGSPTVTTYGNVVHVNFHREWKDQTTVARKDPVTKQIKRVARRFDRSDIFYTEAGRLIGDYDD